MAMTSNGVKKKIAIIQARMGSSRMPGKILKEIAGKPVLWHLLENIKHSRELTDIVVATTGKKEDDALEEFAREYGVNFFDSTYPYYRLMSNSLTPGFPYGLYFELFDVASLKEAYQNATTEFQKEHVTPYIRENEEKFPAIAIESRGVDFSDIYLSIDTPEDFERNRQIIEYLGSKHIAHPFRFNDVVSAYKHLRLSKTST